MQLHSRPDNEIAYLLNGQPYMGANCTHFLAISHRLLENKLLRGDSKLLQVLTGSFKSLHIT